MPLVLLSVAIDHLPESVSESILVASLVVIAIGPRILTFAVLLIKSPLSLIIFSAVCPHGPQPAHLIVFEVPFEDAAIKHENPFPMPLVV